MWQKAESKLINNLLVDGIRGNGMDHLRPLRRTCVIRALGNWGTKVDPFGVVTHSHKGAFSRDTLTCRHFV